MQPYFVPSINNHGAVAVEAGDGIVMITSDGAVTRVADRGNSPLETFMFPSINDQG